MIGGVDEKVRDRRLVDHAAHTSAQSGRDDLVEEIRLARIVRAAA
jgi:chromate reductase